MSYAFTWDCPNLLHVYAMRLCKLINYIYIFLWETNIHTWKFCFDSEYIGVCALVLHCVLLITSLQSGSLKEDCFIFFFQNSEMIISYMYDLFYGLCKLSARTKHLLMSWIGRLLHANTGQYGHYIPYHICLLPFQDVQRIKCTYKITSQDINRFGQYIYNLKGYESCISSMINSDRNLGIPPCHVARCTSNW